MRPRYCEMLANKFTNNGHLHKTDLLVVQALEADLIQQFAAELEKIQLFYASVGK